MTLILDSSGVLAAIDERQEDHAAAREAFVTARGPLSPFVLAEIDYVVMTRYGQELALLEEIERGNYRLGPFSAREVIEARRVMERYADLGLGLADASNVVLAGRHGKETCSPSTSGASAPSPGREISPSGCSLRTSNPNSHAGGRCTGSLGERSVQGAPPLSRGNRPPGRCFELPDVADLRA